MTRDWGLLDRGSVRDSMSLPGRCVRRLRPHANGSTAPRHHHCPRRRHPDVAWAHAERGRLLARRDRYTEALVSFDRALSRGASALEPPHVDEIRKHRATCVREE